MTTDALTWNASRWTAELEAELRVAGEGYCSLIGREDETRELEKHPGVRLTRTSYAMLAVGIVMNRLAEVPGMEDHPGLAPLHDLVASLWELGRGGRPALLQPTPSVGQGREHISDRWVRQHALLFVALLEAAKVKGACAIVAEILAKRGHVGRVRHGGPQPLSKGTVTYWRTQSRQSGFAARDAKVAGFLDRHLKRYKASSNWPLSPDQTLAEIERMASSPLMLSKSC